MLILLLLMSVFIFSKYLIFFLSHYLGVKIEKLYIILLDPMYFVMEELRGLQGLS